VRIFGNIERLYCVILGPILKPLQIGNSLRPLKDRAKTNRASCVCGRGFEVFKKAGCNFFEIKPSNVLSAYNFDGTENTGLLGTRVVRNSEGLGAVGLNLEKTTVGLDSLPCP